MRVYRLPFYYSLLNSCHLFLFFILFLYPPYAVPVSFHFRSFSPDSNEILLQGDAVNQDAAIELINRQTYASRVGLATYAKPVQIWDSETGGLTDFESHFSFTLNTGGGRGYGHGLTFFLAPVGFQIPPNSAGGFLGVLNTTSPFEKAQIVFAEFDSYWNEEFDPPTLRGDHVGFNNHNISSDVYVSWNASLHSGEKANVWVTYNSSTKNLSMLWTYRNLRNSSTLSYQVDLKRVLPEQVTIGFSAATGMFVNQKFTIHSWEFNSTLEVKDKRKKNGGNTIGAIVGLSVSVVVLIVCLVAALLIVQKKRSKKRKKEEMVDLNITGDFGRGAGPQKFPYKELVEATDNFSGGKKLGEGGFGEVYKGFLKNIQLAVAVKKISRGSKQGRKEYTTEVKVISQLRHRNLVQLIGWCHERGEFLLVYEFMPQGSLDIHLFSNNQRLQNPLSWGSRYKIALGIASALLYLHEEWEQCVIHRDIKSSNVMLDSNFNAKLGDFGLAKLMDHELGAQTTVLAGTLGYMAPEYIRTRKASKESDVYSFGVVILEIACGRKATATIDEETDIGFVEWVWKNYGTGTILEAVDERLGMDFDVKQMECSMVVGLWCAHPDHKLRPSIKQVLQVLNFEAAMPDIPKKMPIPTYNEPAQSIQSIYEPSITCTSFADGR